MSYNLTVVRMTIIKILQMIDAGKSMETRESFDTVGLLMIMYISETIMENRMEISLKTKNGATI